MNQLRPAVAKQTIELSLDSSLLADAKAFGIDLSASAEEALRQQISRERARRWVEENRAAIEISNEELGRNGLWSDGLRLF